MDTSTKKRHHSPTSGPNSSTSEITRNTPTPFPKSPNNYPNILHDLIKKRQQLTDQHKHTAPPPHTHPSLKQQLPHYTDNHLLPSNPLFNLTHRSDRPNPRHPISQLRFPQSPYNIYGYPSSKPCKDCKEFLAATTISLASRISTGCNPIFHTMLTDFPKRSPFLELDLRKDRTSCILTYININTYKDVCRRRPPPLPETTITNDTLSHMEYISSTRSSNEPITKHNIPGRTINNTLYYPHTFSGDITSYQNQFNSIPTLEQSTTYHSWTECETPWPQNLVQNLPAKISLISFNNWLRAPALIYDSDTILLDVQNLMTIARTHNIQMPPEFFCLLTNLNVEYLHPQVLHYILQIYKDNLPSLRNADDNIGPFIPIQSYVRGLEILECWLAPKIISNNIFTPITGTLTLLRILVPYIHIAGIIFIPYSIVKLLIPYPPPLNPENMIISNNHPDPTNKTPIHLSGWLHLHLLSAANTAVYGLNTNPVIPVTSILGINHTTLEWVSRMTKETSIGLSLSLSEKYTQTASNTHP